MTFSIQFHADEPHLTENGWKLKVWCWRNHSPFSLLCLKRGKTPDGNNERHEKPSLGFTGISNFFSHNIRKQK